MTKAAVSIVTLALLVTVGVAQVLQPPFRDPGDVSPRIAALRRAVASGDATAVPAFWDELKTRGTPLVEPVTGNPGRSLTTFVWRGSSATRNVVIVDGVAVGAGGVDPRNSQMVRLDGTDVWYRAVARPRVPSTLVLDRWTAPTICR